MVGRDIDTNHEFESTSKRPITRGDGRITLHPVAMMNNETEAFPPSSWSNDIPVISLYVNEKHKDALCAAIPNVVDRKRLLVHLERGYSYRYWEGPTE